MFIGHFAVGFASKRWAPRTNLAVLLAAPLLLDAIWPVLILTGLEHARLVPDANPFLRLSLDDYPWSHSLLMSLVWSALFGGAVWRLSRDRAAGWVVAAGVLSHWLLDWMTHRPDMPLFPGSARYGLGLWTSEAGTVAVESAMLLLGLGIYFRATSARDRIGAVGAWGLGATLFLLYAASLFSPPPPNMAAVGVAAIAMMALFLTWAFWADRHRAPATAV